MLVAKLAYLNVLYHQINMTKFFTAFTPLLREQKITCVNGVMSVTWSCKPAVNDFRQHVRSEQFNETL